MVCILQSREVLELGPLVATPEGHGRFGGEAAANYQVCFQKACPKPVPLSTVSAGSGRLCWQLTQNCLRGDPCEGRGSERLGVTSNIGALLLKQA